MQGACRREFLLKREVSLRDPRKAFVLTVRRAQKIRVAGRSPPPSARSVALQEAIERPPQRGQGIFRKTLPRATLGSGFAPRRRMTTMRAAVFERKGKISIREVPRPEPAYGQAVIRVR